MPGPLRFGREFLVNTTVHGMQQTPAIIGLENGGFAVVWDAHDTAAGAIHGQLFSSEDRAVGGEFQVNTTTARDQSEPSVAGLADGRFVVSWRDTSATGGDTSVSAIRAQMYNVDGSPAGGEFLVHTRTDGFQNRPAVAALADGGFVIAWEDDSGRLWNAGDDISGFAIRAQLFDRDGGVIGGEVLVNTTTENDQRGPAVTGLTGGRFVVSWSDLSETSGDTSADAVRAQLFDSDGSSLGREILVNTATENWQQAPTVTGLAGGGFVISWTDDSQTGGDPFDSAVRAQVFSATDAMVGAEILVNTSVGGRQSDPAVAALAEGGFVVGWVDRWGSLIRAQVFDGEGAMVGGEFVVNTTTTSEQVQPSVAALADGRFVIGWGDDSATGGDMLMTAMRSRARATW
ncbi:hypothetical protein LCL97_02600 [Seohaeicola saemankumensis]|nr:hypothetical protein [Seohaeicola saemankumensis]MCA0869705.1 hypothetical protein [Seohaeicola saemankumensis]